MLAPCDLETILSQASFQGWQAQVSAWVVPVENSFPADDQAHIWLLQEDTTTGTQYPSAFFNYLSPRRNVVQNAKYHYRIFATRWKKA